VGSKCSLLFEMGVVIIKQAKKDVKWALKTIKNEIFFMVYHLNYDNHGKLVFLHSYECQGIQIKKTI
jgi:hypothetical protein